MDNLMGFAQKHKPQIRKHLNDFLRKKLEEDQTQIEFYRDFVNRLLDFADKGKMLRGLLTVLSNEMYGGKTDSKIYNIAAAIEIIHSALLIHDDIIDNDDIRRGEQSVPAQYSLGKDKNYGNAMAVCAADIAFFLAIELLSENAENHSVSQLSKEIQRVAAAEMIDYHFGASDEEPDTSEILNLYKNKSARYTFSLPLKIGSLTAGASQDSITKLELFGEKLGNVFQIIDDQIGLLGDEEKIGKPVGSDIRQNKKTVFRAYLFKAAEGEDREYLKKTFGNTEIDKDDIEKVKGLLKKYEVVAQVNELIKSYSLEAQEVLDTLDDLKEYKVIFEELVEYNLKRVS